jgi:N-acetylmuramoyl-L-alanine amidase
MLNFGRVAMISAAALFLVAAAQAPDSETRADDAAGVSIENALLHDDVLMPQAGTPALPQNLATMVDAMRDLPKLPMTAEATCMATAVYWESKGEPLAGQLAVAQVIMNRVKSGRWADSVCGVVYQKQQFSFINDGRSDRPVEAGSWATAQAVAMIAMSDSWAAIVPGATSFHASRINPGWNLPRLGAVGRHVFYR